jgi:hypothetical protein
VRGAGEAAELGDGGRAGGDVAGRQQRLAPVEGEIGAGGVVLGEPRQRAAEQRCGRRHVVAGQGAPAGRREVLRRARADRPARRVERTELGEVLVRLLEMPPDRLVVLAGGADARRDPVGEPPVQLGARAFQKLAIGRVADQHVMEAQRRLAQIPGGIGLDELAAAQPVEPFLQRVARLAWQQRGEGGAREAAPDHRRALEHGALLGAQPLDARGEQRVDRRRHLQRVQRHPGRPAVAFAFEERRRARACARARRRRGDCPRWWRARVRRWQRAARRRRRCSLRGVSRRRRRDRRASSPRATRPPARVSAGRVSRSSGRAASSTSSGVSVLHSTRCSVRSSSSGSAHCTSSIASTIGRRAASPARRRRTTKNVSSGAAGAPASSAATPPTTRARSASSPGSAVSTAARTASALAPSSSPRWARSASASGAKVAPRAASQRASSDRGCVADAAPDLAHEPRLAEPGRAQHDGEAGAAGADGVVVDRQQTAQLVVASDERGRGRADRTVERDQPVRRHRLGAAAQRELAHRRQGHEIGDQAVRRLAEEHVAVVRLLLQAGGDVDRIADDVGLVGAHDHLAGVHGDAQADPAHHRALVSTIARKARCIASAARTARIAFVLGDARHAERRHDPVAEQLHHRAAVRGHGAVQRLIVAVHHGARRLGVEAVRAAPSSRSDRRRRW